MGVAISLGAWSCTDEVEYTPTEPTGTDEVFFSNEQNTDLSLTLDATQVDVTLNRLRDDDELTVNLTSSSFYINDAKESVSAANVFTVPSSVTFSKGQKEAVIRIAVNFSAVEAAVDYLINIAIDSEQSSPYGNIEETFTVSYEPWTDWTRLSETGNFQQAGLWTYNYENYVYYRKSLINPDLEQYSIGGPFSDFVYDYVFTVDKSKIVKVNGADCYFVTMDPIATPLATSDGQGNFIIKDFYYFFCEANKVDPVTDYELVMNFLIENGRSFSYFNPKTGLIASYQTVVAEKLEPGYSYGSFMNYLQLGGYADYFIEFSKIYNIVDESGAESVVIEAYKSDDVYSYAYNVIPGNLDDAAIAEAVEAIKADTDATLYTETQRYFVYTPEAQGDYTIVAVGFNQANEEVYHTSYTFTFTTVKADSEWEPAGTAAYTDGFLYTPYASETEEGWDIPVGGDQWVVNIEKNKNNPNLIRLVNPYNSKCWPDGYEGWELDGNYYMTINMEDPEAVYIEEGLLGVQLSPNDGPINISSLAYEYMNQGVSLNQLKQLGFVGTLEDGKITFPGASLLIEFMNNPGFLYTNWDFKIPIFVVDEAGKTSFNFDGQIKGTGWFELDLTSSNIASAPKKNHSGNVNAQRSDEFKSSFKGRARKVHAAQKMNVNELIKANFNKAARYSDL